MRDTIFYKLRNLSSLNHLGMAFSYIKFLDVVIYTRKKIEKGMLLDIVHTIYNGVFCSLLSLFYEYIIH
jgi:hypothetical protein